MYGEHGSVSSACNAVNPPKARAENESEPPTINASPTPALIKSQAYSILIVLAAHALPTLVTTPFAPEILAILLAIAPIGILIISLLSAFSGFSS